MSDYYEPELGQAVFGQPYKEYGVSQKLRDALSSIDKHLCLKMERLDKNFESPFANSGNKFYCDTFEVESYSWDDEVDQPWNFKWRDIEVSWYKYFGRGMSVNKNVSDKEIEEMLDECLTCRYWARHKDKLIGTCTQLNEYRFQHEHPTAYCHYVFGEDRPACKDRRLYYSLPEMEADNGR